MKSNVKDNTSKYLRDKLSNVNKNSYVYEIIDQVLNSSQLIYLPSQQDINEFIVSFLSLMQGYESKVVILVDNNNAEQYKKKFGNKATYVVLDKTSENISKTINREMDKIASGTFDNQSFDDFFNENIENVGIILFDNIYTIDTLQNTSHKLFQYSHTLHYFGLTCSPFLFIDAYKLRNTLNLNFYTPIQYEAESKSFCKCLIEKSNLIPFEEDLKCINKLKEGGVVYDGKNKQIFDYLVKNSILCSSLFKVMTGEDIHFEYTSKKLEILTRVLFVLKIRKNCLIVKNEKNRFLISKYFRAKDDKFNLKADNDILVTCSIKTHEDIKFEDLEEYDNYILFDFMLMKSQGNKFIFCGDEQKKIFKKILAAEEIIEERIKVNIKSKVKNGAKNKTNFDDACRVDDERQEKIAKPEIKDHSEDSDRVAIQQDTILDTVYHSEDSDRVAIQQDTILDTVYHSEDANIDTSQDEVNEQTTVANVKNNKKTSIDLSLQKRDRLDSSQVKNLEEYIKYGSIDALYNNINQMLKIEYKNESEVESVKDYSFENTLVNSFDGQNCDILVDNNFSGAKKYFAEYLFKIFMDQDISKEIESDLHPILQDFYVKDGIAHLKIKTNNPTLTSFLLSKTYEIPTHHKNYSRPYLNHFGFYALSFGHINFYDSFIVEKEFKGTGYLFMSMKRITILLFCNNVSIKIEIEGSNLEKFTFVNIEESDLLIYLPLEILPKVYYCFEVEQKIFADIKNLPFNKKLNAANELMWKRMSIVELEYMKNSFDIRLKINLKGVRETRTNLDYSNKYIMQKYASKEKENFDKQDNYSDRYRTGSKGYDRNKHNVQDKYHDRYATGSKGHETYSEISSLLKCLYENLYIIDAVVEKIGHYSSCVCFSPIISCKRTGLKSEELKKLIFSNYSNLTFSDYYSLEVLFCKKSKFFSNKVKCLSFIENMNFDDLLHFLKTHVKNRFKGFEKATYQAKHSAEHQKLKKNKLSVNMIRTAVITPFTVKFQYPQYAISNRVIRHFESDFFLKVSFKEEDNSQLKKGDKNDSTYVFECFKKYMKEGIVLGTRRYFFLAMSSSQLKLHSAWFIAPYFNNNILIGADFIRNWLGDFRLIKNIGKYAMRLGQALSSTSDTITIQKMKIIEDIERNGYCFSDGIGIISYELAKNVSACMKLDHVPSAFQIRMGGFKGVVSVYSDNLSNFIDNAVDKADEEDVGDNGGDEAGCKVCIKGLAKAKHTCTKACKKDCAKTKYTCTKACKLNMKFEKYKKMCRDAMKETKNEYLTKTYTVYKNLRMIRVDLTKSEESIEEKSSDKGQSLSCDVNNLECTNNDKKDIKANNINVKNRIDPEDVRQEETSKKNILVKELLENGILLRKSMKKFESNHKILEVVTFSQNIPGYLNRQIIIILNSLGIPNSVFIALLDQFLYSKIFKSETPIKYMNEKIINDDNKNEKFYLNMQEPIFMKENNDIIKKSKVFVCKSRVLMGILDEYGILKPNEVFIQVSLCKVCNKTRNTANRKYACGETTFGVNSLYNGIDCGSCGVITGSIAIAKNPCLHPGDLRIVTGVDVKELRFLKDCVVFSSQGDRPIFNMCSGSDLDGDCYFCTWDDRLIPKRTVKPDTYSSNTALYKEIVSMDDIINFYIRFIRENQLGLIANAHLAISDKLNGGVLEPESIKLAKLFNLGVDFPKTGFVARIPFDLQPEAYPDFMEQGYSYESNKILGIMYRRSLLLSQIEYSNCECLENPTTYLKLVYDFRCRNIFNNKRINENCNKLQKHSINERNDFAANCFAEINNFENDAKYFYARYKSELSFLMGNFNIKNENEAFLGFTNGEENDKSILIGIKEITKKYRKIFSNELCRTKRFYKAFSWYKISHENCDSKFLSFGWINGDVLNENVKRFEETKNMYSKLNDITMICDQGDSCNRVVSDIAYKDNYKGYCNKVNTCDKRISGNENNRNYVESVNDMQGQNQTYVKNDTQVKNQTYVKNDMQDTFNDDKENVCRYFDERNVKYQRFVICKNIIFIEDSKILSYFTNKSSKYYINENVLIVKINIKEYEDIKFWLVKNDYLREIFLILFAMRFFEIENFEFYFEILKYFKSKDKKEIFKVFFELSMKFYILSESKQKIFDDKIHSKERTFNSADALYGLDSVSLMQKSNFLLVASKIYNSCYDLGVKLLASENVFFESKKKKFQKNEKPEMSYKKKAIELAMHGMFDNFDRVFFTDYKDECLPKHKNIKKYIPFLLNKGDCSVESYKDNLRSFLLNNAGYEPRKDTKSNAKSSTKFEAESYARSNAAFESRKDTIITVKIYQGKLYFFDISTHCINNNILISEIEKLIETGENEKKKQTNAFVSQQNDYGNLSGFVNNTKLKEYVKKFKVDCGNEKVNRNTEKPYNNARVNNKRNENINEYSQMHLNSYFLNLHELVRNDLEEYIKNKGLKAGQKEAHCELIFVKDKIRYVVNLDEKMEAIKISKNRNISGRFFIVNQKDTLFEMIKEDLIYCKETGIDRTNEEEKKLKMEIVKKEIRGNEQVFVLTNLNQYSDFRLEEYTTCKLSKMNHNKAECTNEVYINASEQKIDSSFDLCIKKVYKMKRNDKILELYAKKMSCEGKVKKVFENVNFRTFDLYFEEIWNVFKTYVNTIE